MKRSCHLVRRGGSGALSDSRVNQGRRYLTVTAKGNNNNIISRRSSKGLCQVLFHCGHVVIVLA